MRIPRPSVMLRRSDRPGPALRRPDASGPVGRLHGGGQLTVSVPFIPACSCPGTEQK